MPVLIKATAVPQSVLDLEYRLKDAVCLAANHCRSTKTNLPKLVGDLEVMYAELHEALDLQPTLVKPLPTLPVDTVVSIQVQTTRLTGGGVELVSFKEQHNLPTHWSLYKRLRNGQAVWIEDIPLGGGRSDTTYTLVMVKAAKYSQMYKAFIETPF